jgi:hypothetical protein
MKLGPAVAEIVGALVIEDLGSYAWLGQRFRVRAEDEGDVGPLVRALAARLYADFYIAGDVVAVRLPKESVGLRNGFYLAFGDAGDPIDDGGAIDRFYFNARPEGRAALIGELTGRLNRAPIAFRLKVLNEPRALRCDAAVLYVPAAERAAVTATLAAVAPRLEGGLRASTPPFTLRLAPGIAFAEDPPGDASFGQHRCRLVADALVDAHLHGLGGAAERALLVATRWGEAELDADATHRNSGSTEPDPAPFAA